MSVSFFNIKSGEERVLDDPAHIAAFVNSSNMGKNSNKGQDFAWRIAPELRAKVDEYSENPTKLQEISQRLGVPMDAIEVVHVLSQIAYEQSIVERANKRAVENNPAHAEEYEQRLQAAKISKPIVEPIAQHVPVAPTHLNKPATKK